jgi:hypothetical protein
MIGQSVSHARKHPSLENSLDEVHYVFRGISVYFVENISELEYHLVIIDLNSLVAQRQIDRESHGAHLLILILGASSIIKISSVDPPT